MSNCLHIVVVHIQVFVPKTLLDCKLAHKQKLVRTLLRRFGHLGLGQYEPSRQAFQA